MTRPIVMAGPVEHTQDGETREIWWVRCPGCGAAAMADREQIEGEVSLDCPLCDYHETHDLTDQEPEADNIPF